MYTMVQNFVESHKPISTKVPQKFHCELLSITGAKLVTSEKIWQEARRSQIDDSVSLSFVCKLNNETRHNVGSNLEYFQMTTPHAGNPSGTVQNLVLFLNYDIHL
ncbi:hypothetical protein CRM22_001034 [Opisthorchis felineus]|uniref:Uncharacterized protein n=1 Tax=Opisthorchis felineus TaxID=147828 RepID=A0A4S2MCD4_OPIFE|nr:hypothetical protein CRM22_001034 [Opisthorchis felineus]